MLNLEDHPAQLGRVLLRDRPADLRQAERTHRASLVGRTTDDAPPPISHRGILAVLAVLVAIGTIAGFALGGVLWGSGILFGGVLSFVNYLWLKRSTRLIFEQPEGANTGILAAKYILRYVVIGAILLLVYLTDALPIAAVIIGLAAFAVAVVLQGIKNIFIRN